MMIRIRTFSCAAAALIALAAAAAPGPALAKAAVATPTTPAPEIRLPLDQARAISAPGIVRGVVIGNPAIAGVSVQNDRLVFVTGRTYGTTNVILVGERGPIFSAKITVVAEEADAVIVTKGAWSVRYDCAPECKRRPDISDEPTAFGQAMSAIGARAGAANQ